MTDCCTDCTYLCLCFRGRWWSFLAVHIANKRSEDRGLTMHSESWGMLLLNSIYRWYMLVFSHLNSPQQWLHLKYLLLDPLITNVKRYLNTPNWTYFFPTTYTLLLLCRLKTNSFSHQLFFLTSLSCTFILHLYWKCKCNAMKNIQAVSLL